MKYPKLADLLFFTALALYIVFILSLQVFPTGDGPLHAYYANVFRSLIAGPSVYSSFYAIRHIIQPYCLHYFSLLLLERFVTPEMGEKLFIASIVANMAIGFRFLVRGIGSNAAIATLFLIPLLFSWSLSAGFLNYCFASGVLYWAMGLYVRMTTEPDRARRHLAWFLFTLFVLILSHPVPLLLLIALIAGDLALRILNGHPGRRLHLNTYAVSALALSCVAFVAPMLLADKSRLASIAKDFHPHVDLVKEMVYGRCLGMFSGADPLALVSRYGTVLIVPLSVVVIGLGAWGRWKQHALTTADRLFLTSLIFLLGTLTLPHAINGSYYFPQRMWDIAWPLVLAGMAAAPMSKVRQGVLSATALVLIAATFTVAWNVLREAASMQNELGMLRLPVGERGLFVEPDRSIHGDKGKTNYPVFYWGGMRSFMKNGDVLINSPWIDQTTMPVKSKETGQLLMDTLPDKYGEHPFDVEVALAGQGAVRDQMLKTADFILYEDPRSPKFNPLDRMQALLRERAGEWDCQPGDIWAVCVKKK